MDQHETPRARIQKAADARGLTLGEFRQFERDGVTHVFAKASNGVIMTAGEQAGG